MNKKLVIAGIGLLVVLGGYVALRSEQFQSPLAATVETKPLQKTEAVSLKDGDSYTLTASYVTKTIAGKSQRMLAYNGSIPGPTIEVTQGATVTINLKNDTDMPQLLHSHGIRMEDRFDGSQMVQKEIQPGETFAYTLTFPDAGIYWYHPHAEEVYGQALGLYGAFMVSPKVDDYYPKVNQEVPLFLSDLPIEKGAIAIEKSDNTHTLMGHYGNTFLTNGEENYTLNAQAGSVVRLHIINAANTRPFNFAIKGLKMKLVGGDSGAHEHESWVDSVILAPSERATVDVLLAQAGTYEMQNQTPNKSYTLGSIIVDTAKVAESYESDFNTLHENKYTKESIDPFRKYFDAEPAKKLNLTLNMNMGGMGMSGMQGMNHGGMMGDDSKKETINLMGMEMTREQAIEHCQMMPNMSGCAEVLQAASQPAEASTAPADIEWEDTMAMMNEMSKSDMVTWKLVDEATGKVNKDINLTFKKNEPVKIRITNDAKSVHPMQHPIHFHGQRFLVVSRNGVKETNLVWKDTVLVKTGETVDIILDPSNPGDWMAHCHIAEHLAGGMMLNFKVE